MLIYTYITDKVGRSYYNFTFEFNLNKLPVTSQGSRLSVRTRNIGKTMSSVRRKNKI